MACQPISSWEAAPAACISAVICIASLVGYSNSLVMKDQMEVSPLSCGVCFISSPFPYRMALACSIFLCPQPYRHSLQFAFPMMGERATDFSRSACIPEDGLGPVCSPVVDRLGREKEKLPILTTCLLAQASQHLWLVGSHDV